MLFCKIIWLYGMSDAGKTTLGRRLAEDLGFLFIDSDYFRHLHWAKPDFTPEGRRKYQNELRSEVARLQLADTEGIVVASITPYKDMRVLNRAIFDGSYYEALIKCDLDTLIERDSKGLYKRALCGEIENFTGISDLFEEADSDIVVDTARLSIEESYILLWAEVNKWLLK